jgi:hypothetical protein
MTYAFTSYNILAAEHTRGHNTLLLDGANQVSTPAVATEPLVSGQDYIISDDHDWTVASITFEDVSGLAVHTRALHYERGLAWIAVDVVTTDRQRNVTALACPSQHQHQLLGC